MNFKNKIKYFLWKHDYLKREECPICKSETLGHGFSIDPNRAKTYTCTNQECELYGGIKT